MPWSPLNAAWLGPWLPLLAVTVACNERTESDPALELLAERGCFAVESELLFASTRVLHSRLAAEGVGFAGPVRVDGVSATWGSDADTVRIEFDDEVGRSVTLELRASDAPAVLQGRVVQCIEGRCDRADVEARPLGTPESEPAVLALLGEFRQEGWEQALTVDLAVDETRAYVVRGPQGLSVVDVTVADDMRLLDERQPSESGEFWNDAEIAHGRWVLVASSSRGLVVFDAADPARLVTAVDGYPGIRSQVHNIFVAGDRIYLARTGPFGGLTIVDFGDPPALRTVADLALPECPQVHDALVTDDTAFLSCLEDGLQVYDLEDPAAPELVARLDRPGCHSTRSVDVAGPNGGIVLVTTSEGYGLDTAVVEWDAGAERLVPLATVEAGSAASPHDVRCGASRCLLTHYQDGVLDLDLTEPSQPVMEPAFRSWSGPCDDYIEGASGVRIEGGFVYVADTERGLMVLERR